MIPLSEPEIQGNEWKYVKECLDTGWVSSGGAFVERFERLVAARAGARHGVAVVNGTAALHAALRGSGVEPGDEVLVPALTFVATANAVTYCGAHPVFMDIAEESWGLDPAKVGEFVERECEWRSGRLVNRGTGRRVRAIVPVHLLGHPVDMDPLLDLAGRFRLAVIEDACQALGAAYRGRAVGHLGNVGCFSFNGNKVVTAGGGGVVVTDDEALARRVRHLTTQARLGAEYVHDEIGFNYRLTSVCAAIGVAQMERLDEYVNRKAAIAARYRAAFHEVPSITCMPAAPWATPSHWLFTIRVVGAGRGSAEGLVGHLRESGIEARRLWRPLHRLPMYCRAQAYRIDLAETVYRDAVSLPSSVGLTEPQQELVSHCVQQWAAADRGWAKTAAARLIENL